MSAAERLSEELWPGREYNRLTNVEQSYTLILDAGRMPTVRGPRGKIADRTVTRTTRDGAPGLHAAYFLAYLPGQDPDFPHNTVTLVDYDYWRKAPERLQLHEWQYPEGRYRIELWDACPDDDETGNPEVDYVWIGNNPHWQWDVPARFGLTGARAALEVFAAHLVREPLDMVRSRRAIQARVLAFRRRHAWALKSVPKGSPYFVDAVERFNDWKDRPALRAHDRLVRRMIAAAEAAEAPVKPPHPYPFRAVQAVAARRA